ncbi:MAG: hypothetical protein Q4F65_00940 [Propionibacteriaceae bacterium]|nr:hypothetical protein [Propionibacteriaceae bacterium]
MSAPEFQVCHHALERALDMGVDGNEIRRAVTAPQDVRDGRHGCELRTAGRIVVVFNPAAGLVVTVMWRYEKQRRTDAQRADDYGRKPRHPQHERERAIKRATKQRQAHDYEGHGRRNGRARRARRWADNDD